MPSHNLHNLAATKCILFTLKLWPVQAMQVHCTPLNKYAWGYAYGLTLTRMHMQAKHIQRGIQLCTWSA